MSVVFDDYDDPYAGIVTYDSLIAMHDEELLLGAQPEYPTQEEYEYEQGES